MIQQTLIIIKPDGMKHADKIISYYTRAGLKIVAQKTMKADRTLAEKHYTDSDAQVVGMGNKTIAASREAGRYEEMKKLFKTEDPRQIGMKLREFLVKFITSTPVMPIILEGEDAVPLTRKVTGFTDPARAEKGTVRGDMGTDAIVKANNEGRPVMNLVHASGTPEEAEHEIALWFPERKKK
jgi:nucleoside-diphosphate kinase